MLNFIEEFLQWPSNWGWQWCSITLIMGTHYCGQHIQTWPYCAPLFLGVQGGPPGVLCCPWATWRCLVPPCSLLPRADCCRPCVGGCLLLPGTCSPSTCTWSVKTTTSVYKILGATYNEQNIEDGRYIWQTAFIENFIYICHVHRFISKP